jgi:hypothetical protein
MTAEDLKINWDWVKEELFKKARISPARKDTLEDEIRAAMDDCLKKACSLIKTGRLIAEKKIAGLSADAIGLEGGVILPAGRIVSHIKGSGRVCIFLVTIGEGAEKAASRLMAEGDALGGYLMDMTASLAVESLAEGVEDGLRRRYAKEGMSVSMRFSPGYCDWAVEEQFKLDDILKFSRIGVSLTEKGMMVPKKSISAMVAIGPKELFSKRISQCAVCDRSDCDHRRADAPKL